MSDVVIIDYGMGNLKSIRRGLEKVDVTVKLSSDPEVIAKQTDWFYLGLGHLKQECLVYKKED